MYIERGTANDIMPADLLSSTQLYVGATEVKDFGELWSASFAV